MIKKMVCKLLGHKYIHFDIHLKKVFYPDYSVFKCSRCDYEKPGSRIEDDRKWG